MLNDDKYNIFNAVAVGDLEYVKASLAKGINANCESENSGHSLLNIAVENEQMEMVELLLHNGANVNFKSYGGWTPLHMAVDISIDGTIQAGKSSGDEPTSMIKYLLDNGADKYIMECNGQTPLDIAKDYNSKKIIDFLEKNYQIKLN